MARFPRFYVRLAAITYAVLLAVMLFTVLLMRLIGGEAVAWAWAGVERNADWHPVIGLSPGGIEFALVPAGCFMMGNDPEAFLGSVDGGEQCFDEPFWISRTEVTNAQYQECVDVGACEASNLSEDSRFNDSQQPVVGVSWFQARDYAAWAGCRLSTEVQWEYAARGPDGVIFPWGDEFDGSRLNYCDANCEYSYSDTNFNDGYARTAPVGNYSPAGDSWVGAADMSGNVREWMSTIYQGYPYHSGESWENSEDETSARVLRGGSWNDDGVSARAVARGRSSPDLRLSYIGFRICCGAALPNNSTHCHSAL